VSAPDAAAARPAFLALRGRLWPVALVSFATFLFSINDLVMKLLSGDYPLHEMILGRSVVALALLIGWIRLVSGSLARARPRHIGLLTLRGTLLALTSATQYAALAVLPLADATAIFYTAPLIITLLSVAILRDRVAPLAWLAVGLGLAGVMLIVRPGAGLTAHGFAALLSLTSAVVYALGQIITRHLGGRENVEAMAVFGQSFLTITSLAVGITLGNGALAGGENAALEFLLRPWFWPSAGDLALFLALGLISASGGVMMTMAYASGRPSLVAPFEYLALPMSVIWGAIFLGNIPGLASAIGMVAILVAGLLTVLSAARQGRNAAVSPGLGDRID